MRVSAGRRPLTAKWLCLTRANWRWRPRCSVGILRRRGRAFVRVPTCRRLRRSARQPRPCSGAATPVRHRPSAAPGVHRFRQVAGLVAGAVGVRQVPYGHHAPGLPGVVHRAVSRLDVGRSADVASRRDNALSFVNAFVSLARAHPTGIVPDIAAPAGPPERDGRGATTAASLRFLSTIANARAPTFRSSRCPRRLDERPGAPAAL